MIVFELKMDCDIRYEDDGLEVYTSEYENWDKTHIHLEKGDLLFFSESRFYIGVDNIVFILKDIYYKKRNGDWNWKRNLNMIDPYINKSRRIQDYDRIIYIEDGEIKFSEKYLKDVSYVWKRDEKLDYLLNNKNPSF